MVVERTSLKLNQLTAFREVMLTGSVSESARNLGRTQPSISAQLNALEQNLGMLLFERRGGRLHPMPEARYLLEEADTILDKLAATQRNMHSLRDIESGALKIVSMPGPSVFFVPQIISEFVRNREDIEVQLASRSSRQVEQMVSSQRYDIGIADAVSEEGRVSGLLHQELIDCDCLCAMRKDDPLATRSVIAPKDLEGASLAILNDDHVTSRDVRRVFHEAGVSFRSRFETQYFIPLMTFVEDGLAYSIVDALSAESYKLYRAGNEQLTFVPFKPRISLTISIMTPAYRPASNIAREFTNALRIRIFEAVQDMTNQPGSKR